MFTFAEDLARDIWIGIRNLRKNPGFALMAVGSLALGVGATTAMYSVIYAVLIDPFPYKDVANLVSPRVQEAGRPGYRTYYTIGQYIDIAERSQIFDGVVISTITDVVWTGGGEPQRLRGNYVTMNTFDVMGVPPLLGRGTAAADASPGAEPVAVLGYRFWQRQFGGDRDVLGRRLTLNGVVRTVIGVMPQRFMWRGADVYLPIMPRRGEMVEGVTNVHVLGRLKPGITEAQAEADLKPIFEELQRQSPGDFPEKWRAGIVRFSEQFQSGLRNSLRILFGAVGLLLLISCVNVSTLLLTQAASRGKEIAVRASLGAGRLRIVRQLLSESAALALAGGALGVAVARAGLAGIIAMVPPNTIPDEAQISLNIPVLLFALGISLAAALLFGIAPALQLSRRDVVSQLREGARGSSGSRRQATVRSVLVVAEVALSLMLLVGASLMIRTLFAMQNVELSGQPDRTVTLRVPLSANRYPDKASRVNFMSELLRGIESLPGVSAAGLNTSIHPLGNMSAPVEVSGSAQRDGRRVLIHPVNENYTKALGLGLVQGRSLDQHDVANAAPVALVNQAFVRRYLSDRDSVGRVVSVPRLRAAPFNIAAGFQIVGVVRDALNNVFQNEVMPELYIPYTLAGISERLVVLSNERPEASAAAVRAQVYAIDKDQPVMDVKSMDAVLQEVVYSRPRFNLLLFSIFAAMGLLLAVLGIYGVISNSVAQRTHEIGICMALGASLTEVIRMVLVSGVRLIGAGIITGLIGSFLSVRLLAQEVWKLPIFDPYSFGGVALVVFSAGVAACLWPARVAARIDPISALRHE